MIEFELKLKSRRINLKIRKLCGDGRISNRKCIHCPLSPVPDAISKFFGIS